MKWTIKEVSFLRENYRQLGVGSCAEKLGRTYRGVRAKATKLGLSTRDTWTESEELYMTSFYRRKGAGFCAEKLGRTYNSVVRKAGRMGIEVGEVSGYMRIADVAYAAGVHKKSVKRMVQYHNVKTISVSRLKLVDEKWAKGYIASRQRRQEAAELIEVSYTSRDLARIFGVSRMTVLSWTRESNNSPWARKFRELARPVEAKSGEPGVVKLWLYDPWGVEEAKKVRDSGNGKVKLDSFRGTSTPRFRDERTGRFISPTEPRQDRNHSHA